MRPAWSAIARRRWRCPGRAGPRRMQRRNAWRSPPSCPRDGTSGLASGRRAPFGQRRGRFDERWPLTRSAQVHFDRTARAGGDQRAEVHRDSPGVGAAARADAERNLALTAPTMAADVADPPVALLWEALPTAFAARHPDAGIESPEKIPCLDCPVNVSDPCRMLRVGGLAPGYGGLRAAWRRREPPDPVSGA